MPLLLTSKGFRCDKVEKILQREYLQQLTNHQLLKTKIGIITTATLDKENDLLAISTKERFIQLGFLKDNITFFDFDFDDITDIYSFSILYICGGNPYYLLNSIKLSNGDIIIQKLFHQRKLFVIGVSAGALIACPDIDVVNYFTPEQNNCNLNNFKALKLTNKYIFPHYDREDVFKKDIQSTLQKVEKNKQISVIPLKDSDVYFES